MPSSANHVGYERVPQRKRNAHEVLRALFKCYAADMQDPLRFLIEAINDDVMLTVGQVRIFEDAVGRIVRINNLDPSEDASLKLATWVNGLH